MGSSTRKRLTDRRSVSLFYLFSNWPLTLTLCQALFSQQLRKNHRPTRRISVNTN